MTATNRLIWAQGLSIGSGVAKCKSGPAPAARFGSRHPRRLLLAHAALGARAHRRLPGGRAGGREPGPRAAHPSRLRDPRVATAEAADPHGVAQDFVMPDLVSSAADAVQPLPCAPATLAVWHNHPWTGPDSSFGVKTPEDFCS